MSERRVGLDARTLIVGPSSVGKTQLTASALEDYLGREGADGVVVLEFAPEVERDGSLLGGRLERFTSIPDTVWTGVLEAHAPRSDADSAPEALALATDNAERARSLLETAPRPRAVFCNDVTIPLQGELGLLEALVRYCEPADCVVLNGLDSDELGMETTIGRREQTALSSLREWADHTLTLE